jgi:TPR repeat protein
MSFPRFGLCVTVVLLALAYAAPANAQSSPPGGYTETLRWYHRQAEAGDARAQFFLGIKYETGSDVRRDPKMAADWFERAAQQGLADAQFKFAVALEGGLGRPQDRDGARDWYRAAALQGFALAQYNLGVMLLNAAKTEDEVAEAWSWLLRAETAGLDPAGQVVARLAKLFADDVQENARSLAEAPLADVSKSP